MSESSSGKVESLESIEDYDREARKRLTPDLVNYIYRGSESESTLKSNVSAYSKYLLRRRVLQGVDRVDTRVSYFDGRMESELPFFPGCINVSPLYKNALLDILRVSERFSVPIFVSHLSIVDDMEISKIPSLVSKGSSVVWQIYLQNDNLELCYKQARLAKSWGYKGIVLTVDAELNVKLGNETPRELSSHQFFNVTSKELKKVRECTDLPFVVKGVMTKEDAELSIESGAEGVVISNHGGRILDYGQATIEVLPEIVKHLKSKKLTRNAEIFMDGGIRRGTDILKALALGARGCLIGRPIFWAVSVDRKNGVTDVMRILGHELVRTAALCGVPSLSNVDDSVIAVA